MNFPSVTRLPRACQWSLMYHFRMSLDVSVPCGRCGNDIRFGEHICPSCGAAVSRDLRKALEERLESSSQDFRAMRNRVRVVSVLLLVSGLLAFVLGGFGFVTSPESHDPLLVGSERLAFAFNCVVGGAMVVASRFVETHPQKTIVIVFVGWLLVQAMVAILFPLGLFVGILEKMVTLAILSIGFASARSAEKVRKELATHAAALRRIQGA